MSTKISVIITVVVLLAIGALVVFGPEPRPGALWRTSNSAMLPVGTGRPVVIEKNVPYFVGAQGYLVQPEEGGTYPGVVMIHENRGLNDNVREMAVKLAGEGYIVLAVDLLGAAVETQEEARALTANYDQVAGVANLRAAVAYLKNQGVTKVASLGWCFGGAQSLQLALSGEQMDATIIYYGRLATTTAAVAPLHWPVLGIFGDQDQSISVESVNQFQTALNSLGVENEIYIYEGVGHAFANPSGDNYAPDETKDAWTKTLTFLKKHLQ